VGRFVEGARSSHLVTAGAVGQRRANPGSMRGAIQIGAVRGIPIRVHWTFLLVLPLLAALFARNWQEAAEISGVSPGAVRLAPWIWGLFVALGLFASVLLHELAHSLYALRAGQRVRGIVLLMIGGISEIVDPPRRPGQEAMMAVVGPLTSLALGGLLVLGGSNVRGFADLSFALVLLGELNLVLGVFNLLPAFPMDGGRILRATLTPALGAVHATRVATLVGKVFAGMFAVFGLLSGNLLLLLVGFFVWMGASAEGAQLALRESLCDQPVRGFMAPPSPAVDTRDTLDVAAARMREARRLMLPVLDGELVRGVLTLDALRRVPSARWTHTTVSQVNLPVPTVSPGDDGFTVLTRLRGIGLAELPVVEEGRLVGSVSEGELLRAARMHELDAAWDDRRPHVVRRTDVPV
jgi:Zn-dependent protease/predicted transcriptional regulator